MSFTDLERGLNPSPLSPIDRERRNSKHRPGSVSTAASTAPYSRKQAHSAVSPPLKLPSGLQVSRGNSRDSVGLHLQHQQSKSSHAHAHSPYPPPVSPKRKTNNPMAQHSKFLEDNTRFDTPRPTLTPSTSANISEPTALEPRSPQVIPSATTAADSNNRILGEYRPGDQDRRQTFSPLTSSPQLTPPTDPLNDQHREFIRIENNRGPPDSGALPASTDDNSDDNETAIPIDTEPSRSATPVTATPSSISPPWTASSSIQNQEHDYDMMVRHVSQQIFNISSNIAVLERLVPCLGQRHKDTVEMRSSLHAVLDTTQDLVKSAHAQIKVLARYHQPPTAGPPPNIGLRIQTTISPSDMTSWERKVLASRRQTHQRLTKDLSLASRAFQALQKQAVEGERRQVATLRRLSGSASFRRLSQRRSDLMDLSQADIEGGALLSHATSGRGAGRNGSVIGYGTIGGRAPGIMHDRDLSTQEETLLREILAVDGELVFQESILQERESEIRKMEEGMDQVLDVMRELGTLVQEQRGGVDFLQDNILQTRGRIQLAQQEVLRASEYQRQSRERLCYLIMIASIVGALIMLAFVST